MWSAQEAFRSANPIFFDDTFSIIQIGPSVQCPVFPGWLEQQVTCWAVLCFYMQRYINGIGKFLSTYIFIH